MNQELIKLTKEEIKELQGSQSKLESKICTYNNETRELEKEAFKVKNIRKSLEAALGKLEEAKDKEERKD